MNEGKSIFLSSFSLSSFTIKIFYFQDGFKKRVKFKQNFSVIIVFCTYMFLWNKTGFFSYTKGLNYNCIMAGVRQLYPNVYCTIDSKLSVDLFGLTALPPNAPYFDFFLISSPCGWLQPFLALSLNFRGTLTLICFDF